MSKKSTAVQPKYWVWLLIALGILGVALLVHFTPLKGEIKEAMEWAKGVMQAHPVAGAAVFFAFSTLSPMLAFVSSSMLVPPANLVYGKPLTFLLLWAGWTTGTLVAFGIGRLAHPLLVKVGYEEKLKKYQQFISTKMKFWAVLLFCMAIPSEIPGYVFGSGKYPLWKFALAMGTAEAVYAMAIVLIGESLAKAEPVMLVVSAGALLVMIVIAGLLLRKFKKNKIGGIGAK